MSKSFGDQFWDEIEKHKSKNKIDEPFEIGKVISEDPLIIEIEGLSLFKNNLSVNPYLLAWNETVDIENSINGESTNSSVIIHHKNKLSKGVLVTCYGIEYDEIGKSYQRYVVLEVIE